MGWRKMPFFLNAELEKRYLLQSPFLNLWWRRVKDRWENHPERVCTVSGIFDNNVFESFIHFLPTYAWEHDASTSTTLFRYVQQVLEWKICGTINSWLKVMSPIRTQKYNVTDKMVQSWKWLSWRVIMRKQAQEWFYTRNISANSLQS